MVRKQLNQHDIERIEDFAMDLTLRGFFQTYPKPAKQAMAMLKRVSYIPAGHMHRHWGLCQRIEHEFRLYDAFTLFRMSELYTLCQARIKQLTDILKAYVIDSTIDQAPDLAGHLVSAHYLSTVNGTLKNAVAILREIPEGVDRYPDDIVPHTYYKGIPPRQLGKLLAFHLRIVSWELSSIYQAVHPTIPVPNLRVVESNA